MEPGHDALLPAWPTIWAPGVRYMAGPAAAVRAWQRPATYSSTPRTYRAVIRSTIVCRAALPGALRTASGTPGAARVQRWMLLDARMGLTGRFTPDQFDGASLVQGRMFLISLSTSMPFFDRSGSVHDARSKQQGRRLPDRSFEIPTSTRRSRV